MAEVKYMIFKLEDDAYAMKLGRITGIEQLYNLVPIPAGAEYIKGIVHLRGNIIPVYNLKKHFGLNDSGSKATSQLLIAELAEVRLAVEVDFLVGIVSLAEDSIADVPQLVKNDDTGYIENVLRVVMPDTGATEVILSINVDKLMSEEELGDVKQALLNSGQESAE